MSDILHRLIIPEFNFRAYAVNSLETARAIVTAHHTTPNATTALGRAINAAALLSASLKPDSDQILSYKIQGSGPLKELQVQVDAHGNIRGYVARPRIDEEIDLGVISFSKSIGAGLLTVTKDLGMKEPYTGVTHLVKGEIAMDTAYYLTVSEQVPSALVIGLNINREGSIDASGGILIQTFPDTPEKSVELVESKLAKSPETLAEALTGGKDILAYLSDFLDNTPVTVMGSTPLRHRCRCTKELILSVLKTFEDNDISDMIEKDEGAEIHCTFCNTRYQFSKQELIAVLDARQ
jgi:molecular chaperone Hsp33